MKNLIELYKSESSDVFNNIDTKAIVKFVQIICEAWETGNKVFACGNGGNAAYVANLITDLNLHPFVSDDKSESLLSGRLHAINLCESVSTITAILNDIGQDYIFSEQIKFMGSCNDVFIGLSGSGGSSNIIRAVGEANKMEMRTIGITRNASSKIVALSQHSIVIHGTSAFPGQTGANNNNFHFEDCISKLSHIATGILKSKVHEKAKSK